MKNFAAIDFETANLQLQTVAAYCGYDLTQHHNALADAEACAWIARELLQITVYILPIKYKKA